MKNHIYFHNSTYNNNISVERLTRIIGVHTKLRTIPLSHTGIRNNTRITLGEAFQNYRSPCHTGIKNNTRIIGEYTKLRTIPLSHAGIKINTRITESTHYDLATLSLPHNTGIKNNTRIITDAPQPQQDTFHASRVLKIIPALLLMLSNLSKTRSTHHGY